MVDVLILHEMLTFVLVRGFFGLCLVLRYFLRRNELDPLGLFRCQYFDVVEIVVSGSLDLGLSG